MEEPATATRLRYLDAHDVDDAVVDYDGLEVRGAEGASLGRIEGFIVDAVNGRIQYFVVDSSGWLESRRVLVPIQHATLSDDRSALRIDIPRSQLAHLSDFDRGRFREFSEDDIRQYEQKLEELEELEQMEYFGGGQPLAPACAADRPKRLVRLAPVALDDEPSEQ
jgi:hypothetical protein